MSFGFDEGDPEGRVASQTAQRVPSPTEQRVKRLQDLLLDLEETLANRRRAEDAVIAARKRIAALFRGEDV